MRRVDLTNKEFGDWKVLGYLKGRRYLCRCKCGSEHEVLNYHLLSGASTKCRACSGLLAKGIEIGTKIGKYTIKDSILENGETYCLCVCDCGYEKKLKAAALRCGQIKGCKSCGNFKGYQEIPNGYYYQIKRRATDCDFDFNISMEYIWNLFLNQKRKCSITGLELVFASSKDKCRKQTASLDRIDSSEGYIVGNVQWIHKIVNSMKNSLSNEQFVNLCNLIARNNPRDIIDINLPESIFIK